MTPNETFEEALAAITAKLLPDEATQSLAQKAHSDYRRGLRSLVARDLDRTRRQARLDALDAKLLEALDSLADTEPDLPTPTD